MPGGTGGLIFETCYNDPMQTLYRYVQQYFLVRWIVINIVAWSAGLYLGSLAVQIAGFVGILLGGALTGLVVGGAQWWALRQEMAWENRKWITFSVFGGIVSTLLIYIASGLFFMVALVAGTGTLKTIGTLIAGGIFGGVFGAAQMLVLGDYVNGGGFWVIANVTGGALCATCSLSVNPLSLPMFCTLGPVLFGGITGYTLTKLLTVTDKPSEQWGNDD